MSTATLTEDVVETRTTDSPGDAAHIVYVPEHLRGEGVTPQALVLQARVEGTPVTALCGHTWVPQRDPAPLPVCSRCLELYMTRGQDLGERNGPPPP